MKKENISGSNEIIWLTKLFGSYQLRSDSVK